MDTVRDLIRAALQDLGVLGAVEELPAEDAAVGLRVLRQVRDGWMADGFTLYTVQRESFTLTANEQTRTIGDGGHFDTDRPLWIPWLGVTPVGEDVELEVIPYRNREEWFAERWKDLTDSYPRRYLYEPTFPLGTLTFWPVPTTAATIILAQPSPLSTFAINTTLAFPDGYEDALQTELVLRLAKPFRKTVTAQMERDAARAMGRIKRNNDPGPMPSRADAALTNSGGFDIRANRYSTGR